MIQLLRKDLLVLRRSPALLAVLVTYPLLVALLVGVVAGYANTRPRVAFVDLDGVPERVELAGEGFDVRGLIDEVSDEVELVPMQLGEARRRLETGRVVAAVIVPPGFVNDLRASQSPELVLERGRGGLTPIVTREMEALVFNLNRELQDAIVAANLGYVEELQDRLDRTGELLAELPADPRVDEIRSFVALAGLALGQTGDALRATAAPIRLRVAEDRGRAWALSAQVQAYGLALTITFLGLVLAAGALAAERDENVIGRLARGLVPLGRVVAAKVALAAVVALALGLAIALVFGIAVEVGDVTGGQPWERLPLLAAGLAVAGAAVGGLGALVGALSRDGRTASLVAVLAVLPILLVGLVPEQVSPVAAYVSDAFPFAHAVELFSAALHERDPWRDVGIATAWLVGLGLVYGSLARLAARRLLA
ncbi:MAG: ABC transporter permease [Thermoleophilia bacterium]|nr:ABC transporter permease [Thermoleophilia bacterium]